jgi:hypothetical protein
MKTILLLLALYALTVLMLIGITLVAAKLGPPKWKASIHWKWYDAFIGMYFDEKNYTVYWCPVPFLVLKFQYYFFPKNTILMEFSDGDIIDWFIVREDHGSTLACTAQAFQSKQFMNKREYVKPHCTIVYNWEDIIDDQLRNEIKEKL